MFNFFGELKKIAENKNFIETYNIVNMSGRILYVEGHTGICHLSKQLITFKFKGGIITVIGEQMCLAELTDKTIKIVGKIKSVEET